MISSINNSTQSLYSLNQERNYDNVTNENVITTQIKVEDDKLSNLDASKKEELQKQLLELTRALNKEIQAINTNIMFDYEDSINSLVLTVKQRDNGEIIRQIPTDEAMELMKKMRDVISVILDTQG